MTTGTERNITTLLRGRPMGTNQVRVTLPVDEYRTLPIPGIEDHAKLGECFVRVTDLPAVFDQFMEINPRVPNRTKKGVLAGPVIKGILSTLRDTPEEMVLKNQGIYMLVQEVSFSKGLGGQGHISITLSDPGKHGIINGGHTYTAIREAIETAEGEELDALKRAYVRLHLFQGIDEELVPEIAEGLNRSKQVDDPSLINLQGEFDIIRKVMKGHAGEKAIAYHQGDDGDIYISEILVYLAFFNRSRFNDKKHPNQLYRKQGLGLKYFGDDMQEDKQNLLGIIQKLPDILWLADSIRKMTPLAAKNNQFQFGRMKLGAERTSNPKAKGTTLPFLGESVDYRVPNGWVYPMLAAFRANEKPMSDGKGFAWKIPLEDLLPAVIDDLVGVCVTEHRDNNMRPELIGNRESSYSQCYDKIQLYLARQGML